MLRLPDSIKLDCSTKVVTPENIEFEYSLAGPFQRLPAYLLDLVIWNVLFFGLVMLLSAASGFLGLAGLGAVVIFLILVAYFFVSWFYGIFFEVFYDGRTPGKMLCKLRVISMDGRPINGLQAGLRNLLRVADVNVMLSLQMFSNEAPPVYLFPTMIVGLVSMLLTSRMQRIGDLAAGTMVISEQPRYSPWNIQPDDARAFGLAELIPPTFEVSSSLAQAIGLYMENRHRLGVGRREEVAAWIARPLVKSFELLPNTGNDLLLCAMYVRIFLSDQQQQDGLQRLRKLNPSTSTAAVRLAKAGSATVDNRWPVANPGILNAPPQLKDSGNSAEF